MKYIILINDNTYKEIAAWVLSKQLIWTIKSNDSKYLNNQLKYQWYSKNITKQLKNFCECFE